MTERQVSKEPSKTGISYQLPDGTYANAETPEQLQAAQAEFWKSWSTAIRRPEVFKNVTQAKAEKKSNK